MGVDSVATLITLFTEAAYGLEDAMTKGVQDVAQWIKMSRLPAGPSSLWIR